MAVSIKGGMRRPSFSRMSSGRSSADVMPSSRRGSDAASTTPPVNTIDHDLRGPSRLEQNPEAEAPKLGARVAEALKPWSPMPLLAAAKQGLVQLGARLGRGGSREQTGRPLSVINELDETMDAEARRQRTAAAVVGRNGFEYVVIKLWGMSTRVQDAKWQVSSWRHQRSRSTADKSAGNPGSIIVIREIVSQSERVKETV